jgi:hypothetical protein
LPKGLPVLKLKETGASGAGCYTYWYRQVWPEATKLKVALAGAIALALVEAGLCYAAATTIHSIGNGNTQMCTTVPDLGAEVDVANGGGDLYTCNNNSGRGYIRWISDSGAMHMGFDELSTTHYQSVTDPSPYYGFGFENGSGASMQYVTHTRTGRIFDRNKTGITTFKLRRR